MNINNVPAATEILYLVGYKRVKFYCDCGNVAMQRTVQTAANNNVGRAFLKCPLSSPNDDIVGRPPHHDLNLNNGPRTIPTTHAPQSAKNR